MKKTVFIKNAIVLSVSGLILRFIGVIFKIWLASKIGSEGIGLYQLIFSVFVFAGTFATSGISTAVTRLCTDEIANKNGCAVKNILKKCLFISFLVSVVSIFVLFAFSEFISSVIISDKRAVFSLKVLALSLPFMGFCSCFRGYFIARRKAAIPAVSQIIEQLIRILTVIISVKLTFSKGIHICLAGVFLGDAVAEAVSCLILYIFYKTDNKKISCTKNEALVNGYKKIGEIAFPITVGRYINTTLRTTENVLVPKLLKLYKFSKENALSQFGMIKGMALPLVFFPSTLLNSLSTLLLPELSEARTKCEKMIVSATVSDVISTTAIISYIFSSIFFFCGDKIGILIYKNESVGLLIKLLAPIVPFMYLDSICDGMLKGLNQQKFTFFTSVTDSALRIILIIVLLPKTGLLGFIAIMYFSNAFTGLLNISRIIKVSGAKIDFFKTVFVPLLSSILSVCLIDILIKPIFNSLTLVYIILTITLSIVFYFWMILKISGFTIRRFL